MYVRLVRFAFGPGQLTAAQALADDLVPAIGAQLGCLRATCFGDPSTGEYGLYVHWDTKEHADAAAAVIGPRLQQHLAAHAQRPAEIGLYDVLRTSA